MKLNKKNKLLLFGIILTLYLCYEFAISKTLEYYSLLKAQEETLVFDNASPQALAKILSDEKHYNSYFATKSNKNESYQSNLLGELNAFSQKYDFKISEFNAPHEFVYNNEIKNSYSFELDGGFNGVIVTLNEIESNPYMGGIKSVTIIKQQDYKTNVTYLLTNVILEKKKTQ